MPHPVSPYKWCSLALFLLADAAIVRFSLTQRPLVAIVPNLLLCVSSLLPLSVAIYNERKNGAPARKQPTAKNFRVASILAAVVSVACLTAAYFTSDLFWADADPDLALAPIGRSISIAFLALAFCAVGASLFNLRKSLRLDRLEASAT